MILEADKKRICLLAGRLTGKQETAVKPVLSYIEKAKDPSGIHSLATDRCLNIRCCQINVIKQRERKGML